MSERKYFWTKVWGKPDVPDHDALAFNSEKARKSVLETIQPGDIVVYLTSDAAEADPMMRGRVAGAVEIADPLRSVAVEDLRTDGRIKPQDYRDDGRFRWPYGITISRSWHVIDQEANDTLVPGHASKGIQGAATIHRMAAEEVQRFQRLRVIEVEAAENGVASREPFATSLRRPWRQKAGLRAGSVVDPGCELYVAVIHDKHGMTFKIGSGKSKERLAALNCYRRHSQGEAIWSIYQSWEFETVDQARTAEDHLLARARAMGHGSKDHSEFIVGITMSDLLQLCLSAVEVGEQALGQATSSRES